MYQGCMGIPTHTHLDIDECFEQAKECVEMGLSQNVKQLILSESPVPLIPSIGCAVRNFCFPFGSSLYAPGHL